jgi:predicted ribosomally synthesized peptide with SipW-like signal peptide
MKNLLRSFVVVGVALAALTTATSAFFTANVSASNNQITTGTMTAYIGSWLTPTGNAQGQWVAYADRLGNHQVGNFPAITDVEPGVTKSGYVVVANYGSIPFHYQGFVTGSWVADPAFPGFNDASLITVPNVHRYAANNCEADVYCEDIYYWLTNAGYTNISAGALDITTPVVGDQNGAGTSGNFSLSNLQFTIYKVDMQLSGAAGNEYQGRTFNYTLNVNANQLSQSF